MDLEENDPIPVEPAKIVLESDNEDKIDRFETKEVVVKYGGDDESDHSKVKVKIILKYDKTCPIYVDEENIVVKSLSDEKIGPDYFDAQHVFIVEQNIKETCPVNVEVENVILESENGDKIDPDCVEVRNVIRNEQEQDSKGIQLSVPYPVGADASEFLFPDLEIEYPTIETSEQREQYAADFKAEFKEQSRLKEYFQNLSDRYTSLQQRLCESKVGSEEFKIIKGEKEELFQTYERDQGYKNALVRFSYLHAKLVRIVKLVKEYDYAQCVKS